MSIRPTSLLGLSGLKCRSYFNRGDIRCIHGDGDLARRDWDTGRSLIDNPTIRAEVDARIAVATYPSAS